MSQETITEPVPDGMPAPDLAGAVAPASKSSRLRTAVRVAVGLGLAGAGVAHITVARQPFQAQVPETLVEILPFSADDIVFGSGVLEIALGTALVGLPKERRRLGAVTAAYFVAIFPGNIAQLAKRQDAFGLDSDLKRFIRLFFQPLMVLAALFGGENI
jgi:uncharacterized membrane protein